MTIAHKIATMTAQAKLDTLVDTSKLRDFMDKYNLIDTNTVTNKKTFRNQFTTSLPTLDIWTPGNKCHNVSLKVFNNGRLHITGCNSEDMIRHIISKALSLIIVSKSHAESTTIRLHHHEILMINTSFDVGKKLCLHNLWQKLLREHNLCSTYDLKVYVGINSKFISSNGSQVTMLIFNSGKIILTGPRELNSINEAFKFIISAVA